MRIEHPFGPLANASSRVLILGSFPSIASFEADFFYAHPRNAFWPIMQQLFGVKLPDTQSRRAFALSRGIALWDVYASLERKHGNSSDANLVNAVPNDILGFLKSYPLIEHVYCTGRKAYNACLKHHPNLPVPCSALPSTSPAYAAMPFEEKLKAYAIIKSILGA